MILVDIIEDTGHFVDLTRGAGGVEFHPDDNLLIYFQLLLNGVVSKGEELEADTMIVAQLVGLAHDHCVLVQHFVETVGFAIHIGDGVRVHIPQQTAFGGQQLDVVFDVSLRGKHFYRGLAVLRDDEGDRCLQQLRRTGMEDRVGSFHA